MTVLPVPETADLLIYQKTEFIIGRIIEIIGSEANTSILSQSFTVARERLV